MSQRNARYRIALLAFAFLIFSPLALAICNETGTDARLLIENARPYHEIGGQFTFYAYYLHANNTPITEADPNVTVTFLNSSGMNQTSGMIYDGNTRWAITVTSNEREQTNWSIRGESNFTRCLTVQFSTKWRTPFTVDVQLFKDSFNSSATPERYHNDFQYVVLTETKNIDEFGQYADAFNTGVDKAFNAIFTPLGVDQQFTQKVDNSIYFWDQYSNGEATIKLYEPANYTLLIMNNKRNNPLNDFWEFEKPTTGDIDYAGTVNVMLPLYNQTNITNVAGVNETVWLVSFNLWEANQFHILKNWFLILVFIVFMIGVPIAVVAVQQRSIGTAGDEASARFVGYWFAITVPMFIAFVLYIR